MTFYKNTNILRWLFIFAEDLGLCLPKNHVRNFDLYYFWNFFLIIIIIITFVYLFMTQSAYSVQTMLVSLQVHGHISKLHATLASSIKDV